MAWKNILSAIASALVLAPADGGAEEPKHPPPWEQRGDQIGPCPAPHPGWFCQKPDGTWENQLPDHIVAYIREIPGSGFKSAHDTYIGYGGRANPGKAKADLGLHILRADPDLTRQRIAHAKEHDWDPGFIRAAEELLEWRMMVDAMPGEELYAIAQEYRKSPDLHNASSFHQAFLFRAEERKHLPAMVEVSRIFIPKERGRPGNVGGYILRDAAQLGYEPALRELVAQLNGGKDLPMDTTEAYYWALRARGFGIDMEAEIRDLEYRLTATQKQQASGWLSREHYPKQWEK